MTLPIQETKFNTNDVYLHKFIASEKIKKVIDFVDRHGSKPMVKTASSNDDLIKLFGKMLDQLNLSQSDVNEVLGSLISKSKTKTAETVKSGDRSEEIKIASKKIQDSHYQVDVSKDSIKHKGRKLYMVSCYVRDTYLGRYLIKRNYFYTMEREASADEAFDEISKKMAALKDRYYEEILDISGIFKQAKMILDGVVPEVEFSEEDSIGTTVSR